MDGAGAGVGAEASPPVTPVSISQLVRASTISLQGSDDGDCAQAAAGGPAWGSVRLSSLGPLTRRTFGEA